MADFLGGVPYFVKMLALRGTHEVLMLVQHVFRHAPGAGITVDKSRRVATAGADYFRQRARIVIRRSADGGRTFDHGSVRDGVTGLNELRQLQSGRDLLDAMYGDTVSYSNTRTVITGSRPLPGALHRLQVRRRTPQGDRGAERDRRSEGGREPRMSTNTERIT